MNKTIALLTCALLAGGAMAQRLATAPGEALQMNVENARTLSGEALIDVDRQAAPQFVKQNAPASAGYIMANKVYSSTWSDYSRSGIYVMGTDGTPLAPMFIGSVINGTRGMCAYDNQLWITQVYQAGILSPKYTYHYVYSLTNGSLLRTIDPGYLNAAATTMVFDRYTGRLYGCYNDDTNRGYVFGTVDPLTGVRTAIGTLPFALSAMAIDLDGRLWAVNRLTGILYEINPRTGALTQRAKTGLTSEYANSGCIDPLTGTYYYTVCNRNDAGLYTIDLPGGQVTQVCDFPLNDEYVYMWMPTALSGAVPAAATGLTANFEGDALEGEVTFTVPARLANGTVATGQATATVYVDGVATATQAVDYGQTVTLPLAVSENGTKVFAVALSNDQGEGTVARTTLKVGGDNLPAPTGLYMRTFTNGAVRVYWSAYEGENVTYDVTRYPDGTLVAQGITETMYREVPPQDMGLQQFSYGVRAHVNGHLTDEARSESVTAGATALPYDNDFGSVERFNELTYINANGDEYVWTYAINLDFHGTHGIYAPYNARELTWIEEMQGVEPETDDWAVTPGLPLQAGKLYTVTYSMSTKGNDEYYEVKMGTSPTVGGMSTTLIPRSVVSKDVLPLYRQDYSKTFTVNADGTYYIGLHCVSAGGFWLCVYNINVSEGYLPTAPAAPALAIEPNAEGTLEATATVTAPTKTMQGATLAAIDHIDLLLDDQVVNTWQAPEPGSELTAQVSVPRLGNYEFHAVAYSSADDHGEQATATAFVGAKAPADVASVAVAEHDPGMLTITWPAVTTATDGTAIDPALVAYNIYDADGTLLQTVEGDTTVTINAGNPDTQTLVRYYVGSQLGDRHCFATAYTPYTLVGKAYELPFYETTQNGSYRYMWLMGGDIMWRLQTDAGGITSSDGDGSFMWLYGEYIDESGVLTSGKIDLRGSDLTLDFDYLTLKNDSNLVAVSVLCDGALTNLATLCMDDQSATDWTWQHATYSLDDFAGRTVQLVFVGTVKTHTSTMIDGIKVTGTASTLVGDINGDGAVDIEDVNELINAILNDDTVVGGDLTGDGGIDIDDVNALINIILS